MEPLTESAAEHLIRTEDRLVLDFWAEWCPPCNRMSPTIERLATEYAARGVTVAKVDADRASALMQRHGVMGLPTLVLFEKGRAVDRAVGFMAEPQVRARIDATFGAR